MSVNVGRVRTFEWMGRTVTTGIWKEPVDGPLGATSDGLAGDEQADRSVHGGPDKAVDAYALEDEAWWCTELGRPLELGSLGENLTTEGVDLAAAVVGERWAVAEVILEVAQPRIPCYKLGLRLGDPTFPPRFAAAARPGAYLRVIRAGALVAGPIVLLARPQHGVTVGSIERAYHGGDEAAVAGLMAAPALPDVWRRFAERRGRASQSGDRLPTIAD